MLKYGLGDTVRVNKIVVETNVIENDEGRFTHEKFNSKEGTIVEIRKMGKCYSYVLDCGHEFHDSENVNPVKLLPFKLGWSVRAKVYNNQIESTNRSRNGVVIGYRDENTAIVRFGCDKPLAVNIDIIRVLYGNVERGYRYGYGASHNSLSNPYSVRCRKHDGNFEILGLSMKNGRLAYEIRDIAGAIGKYGINISKIHFVNMSDIY